MATKLLFRNLTPGWGTGNNDAKLNGTASGWFHQSLSTAQGASATSLTATTVAGPTNGVEVINTSPVVWYSEPLNADVTISGAITWNLRASESSNSANSSINGRLEVVDGATGTITLIDQTARTTELGTSEAAANFSETPAAGIACKRGDRLRVRIFADDATANMGSGFSVSFFYNGAAGATGDSYLSLTENLTFVSEPAATTIYPTDTASDVSTASVDREAWTSRGAGVQTDVTNTTAGWTAPIQVTDTAGGTVVDWFTKQLTAFTLGGAVRVNARALESATTANASIRCEIARVASDGTSPTVWGATTIVTELTASEAAQSFLVSGDDLAVSDGQRLRIRFYIDDGGSLSAAMGASQTVTLYYAGTSGGASGDTYLTFTQTLTEFSAGTSANAITATATGDAHLGADAVVATLAVATTTGTANNPTARPGIATITDAATATGTAHNATAGAINATVAGTPFSDTSNVASYATASWTPIAGRLYLVAVANSDAANAITPTLSGNGQTWDQVATRQLTDLSRRVTVFRCVAASPTTGALTADFAGDAQTGCNIHVAEFTGFDPSGSNGSGAIVQSVGAEWATGGADPLITLAAFSNANNGTYGAIESNAAFVSVGSGFTQLASTTVATPTVNLLTEWRNSNDTSVDADSGSGAGVGIGIEVKAAAVAATSATAQVATATAAAYDADLLPSQVFSANVATGTGAAGDTDAAVAATTILAAGTGAALPTTAKVTANLGAASGTGAALDADMFPSQTFSAGAATATGAAHDATTTTAAIVSATAQVATATGAAAAAAPSVAPDLDVAAASGTAITATAHETQPVTAGVATASGAAQDVDAKVGATTQPAAATGAASNTTAKVRAQSRIPYLIDATGAAYNASAQPGTRALANVATATGAALVADGLPGELADAVTATAAGTAQGTDAVVAPTLQVAAGTGTAIGATVSTTSTGQVTGQTAQASGAALGATTKVVTSLNVATATGAAANPSVSTSLARTPGVAAGTGAALGIDAKVAPTAGLAAATGTALNATATTAAAASATAQVATAQGAAHAASVGAASNISATASVAAGTGAAYNARVVVAVAAAAATGTGNAQAASIAVAVAGYAETATVTGTAWNAGVALGAVAALAEAALATGTAYDARAQTAVGSGLESTSPIRGSIVSLPGIRAGIAASSSLRGGVVTTPGVKGGIVTEPRVKGRVA